LWIIDGGIDSAAEESKVDAGYYLRGVAQRFGRHGNAKTLRSFVEPSRQRATSELLSRLALVQEAADLAAYRAQWLR
jgi:hypothetical protein